MSYNMKEFPNHFSTAGKITILTAVAGLGIFLFALLFNASTNELMKVEAQSDSASTTLTVLNTPPQWDVFAYEQTESSTSSPTNSGTQIVWTGVASDSNSQPYFMIVCSGSATPTAVAASSTFALGTQPPFCTSGVQWGVSASTTSGQPATVSTTTTEVAPFNELNDWYAWVCDDDPVNPRCNNTYSQGTSATNSSPFHVNRRPVFTSVFTLSGADPGSALTFYSTSTDPDVVGGEDAIVLHICYENDFNATTGVCGPGGTIASTTGTVTENATAIFTLPNIIQDDDYDAYAFLVDEHIHSASGGAHGSNPGFTVNNVAPTVGNGSIFINGGSPLSLTIPGDETTGFTLEFTVSDANSCINTASTSEITNTVVALYRTSYGTTTCDGSAGAYDPNYCYSSGVATTTWNLSCTRDDLSCTGATDSTVDYDCTFPLWFLADPTDAFSASSSDSWSAAEAGVDDDNATGTLSVGTATSSVTTFPALALLVGEIPYGSLEPGSGNPTLSASTTIVSIGNSGLDQNVEGEAMCITYGISTPCPTSATSTIPEDQQRFGTSSVSYASGFTLSSSTPFELELNVPKTVSTSTYSQGTTYWGIFVPASISLAGAYTGLNTFYAVIAEPSDW